MQISMQLVTINPISIKQATVQVMAWRRAGDKSLFEPVIAYLDDAYIRHATSINNALIKANF